MIELLDTHQHLIYRAEGEYSWTAAIEPLAEGDFTVADYAKLVEGHGVAGSLFMETAIDGAAGYQREVEFVARLAADPANQILGIVASIRPEEDEGFDGWLEQCCAPEARVVGFRRILHVVDDAMSQQDGFRANVRKIGQAGKPFDACFLARQLPLALKLAQACDDTQLVLNHCGVPDVAGGELDQWRKDLRELAALDNVACKLSGIMAYCKPGEASYATLRPYVEHVLECFGPARMVWGSDWPVIDLGGGLPAWLEVTRTILAELSEDEARQLAHRTAERLYGVELTS